jgi:hypothetical protein
MIQSPMFFFPRPKNPVEGGGGKVYNSGGADYVLQLFKKEQGMPQGR